LHDGLVAADDKGRQTDLALKFPLTIRPRSPPRVLQKIHEHDSLGSTAWNCFGLIRSRLWSRWNSGLRPANSASSRSFCAVSCPISRLHASWRAGGGMAKTRVARRRDTCSNSAKASRFWG